MKKTLSDISKELNEQSRHHGLPCLIFLTDQKAQPYPEQIIDGLPQNAMVILRDYDHENRHDLGMALRYVCRNKDIKFLVASDLVLALMLEADGIHLPEYMMDRIPKIKSDHPDFVISVSCHNEGAVERACSLGGDLVLVAPVFPTNSHPETFTEPGLTLGSEKVQNLCFKYKVPIYALGGVNVETAQKLYDSGVAGIAAIRGFS